MAVLNYTGEELNAKIVYYGPGLSGKTTNLEYIHEKMPVHSKGKLVSMKTRTDRTLFFDFLPIELGEINGYRTRFLLYTVPGQVYYNATRKLVLKGVDAVVFVADSARAKLAENVEALRNLEDNLNEHGLSLDTLPWVIQYNKRDATDAMGVAEMNEQLNLLGVPAFEAVATEGPGVYETFQGLAGLLFETLKRRLEREDAPAAAAAPPDATAGEGETVAHIVDSALREDGADADAPVPALSENADTSEEEDGFVVGPMTRGGKGSDAEVHERPDWMSDGASAPAEPEAPPTAVAERPPAKAPAPRPTPAEQPSRSDEPSPEPAAVPPRPAATAPARAAAPPPPVQAAPRPVELTVPVSLPRSVARAKGPVTLRLVVEFTDD